MVVKHRTNLTGEDTAHEIVTDLQHAFLDEDRGNHTAALVNLRLDHLAFSTALAARGQFHHFSLQQDGVEQIVKAHLFES